MTLAVDGSGSWANGFGANPVSSTSNPLTTTQSNDVIIFDIATYGGPITAISCAGVSGISLHKRITDNNGTTMLERWWGVAASPITCQAITVTSTSGAILLFAATAISGANTSNPFQGASITGSGAAVDPLSITTSQTAILVAMYYSDTNSAPTKGTGWSSVYDGSFTAANFATEYQSQASGGTYSATLTAGAGTATGGILDAVVATGGGGGGGTDDRAFQNGAITAATLSFRERMSGLLEPVRELWKPRRPGLFVPGFS